MKQIKIFLFMLIGCFWLTSCGDEEDLHLSDKGLADTQPQSTVISLEEAERELISILNELYNPLTRGGEGQIRRIGNAYSRPINKKATRSSEEEEILIHIINFEDEQGFAIMAGDIRLPSLIALAETGSLNEDEPIDNPGLEIFMDGLNDWTITRPPGWGGGSGGLLPPDVDVTPGIGPGVDVYTTYTNWQNKVYFPNGHCKVKWNQDSPYNALCPKVQSFNPPTGCVATAVAQLMSVYQYPSSYNGYHFHWDNMISNPYATYCSLSAQNEIARLMQLLGLTQNLNMNYGILSSGANPENIPRTLRAFGYSKGGTLDSYNTGLVVEELKNGHCVLIGGFEYRSSSGNDYIYEGGHRWLGHGLLERTREKRYRSTVSNGILYTETETEWYILCNWGWGGSGDGYYLSEVFNQAKGPNYDTGTRANEGSTNYFQVNLTAVTGIRK